MVHQIDEVPTLNWPSWSKEDFILKKIHQNDWEQYIKKYPNLLWGTHIYDREGKDLLVCRFVSMERCREYCTAPTLSDEGAIL